MKKVAATKSDYFDIINEAREIQMMVQTKESRSRAKQVELLALGAVRALDAGMTTIYVQKLFVDAVSSIGHVSEP